MPVICYDSIIKRQELFAYILVEIDFLKRIAIQAVSIPLIGFAQLGPVDVGNLVEKGVRYIIAFYQLLG